MARPWRILFTLALIGAALGLRAPYLDRIIWNLDEGSTFTMAEQILAGDVLYRDAADNRGPLVPFLKAAVLAIGGHWNTTAVHAALALGVGLAAVGLWRLARRLGDESAGIASAAAFTLIAFLLLHWWDVFAAHTGWFLMMFSVAGMALYARGVTGGGFRAGLLSGLAFGLAMLCKQPAVLDLGATLVVSALVGWAEPERRSALRRLAAGQIAGLLLVLAVCVAYFAAHGALADLRFYAWTYNTKYYVPEVSTLERVATARMPFVFAWSHVPAALVLGIAAGLLLLRQVAGEALGRPRRVAVLPWLILGWTAAGIVSTALSGRGFSHYAIQVLPGLSLACGWIIARGLELARRHGRVGRSVAAAALAGGIGITGWNLLERYRSIDATEPTPPQVGEIIRRHTRPPERIFVWGYVPDLHVYGQRLPSSRFLYSVFLTGLIPWTNLDSAIDTSYAIVPGSWDQLREDLGRRPPALIVDAGASQGFRKYPLADQTWLWSEITRDFALVQPDLGHPLDLRFYRRLDPVPPHERAPAAVPSDALQLEAGAIDGLPAVPTLHLRAPAGATRIELVQDGRVVKRLPYPAGARVDVVFLLPEAARLGDRLVYRAVVTRNDRTETTADVDLGHFLRARFHLAGAPFPGLLPLHPPGPVIQFGRRRFEPISSETMFGPPRRLDSEPKHWLAHTPSRIIYAHVPGMKSLTVGFGLDPYVYYDRPGQMSSNGADFIVDYRHTDGRLTRLYTRRLLPKWDERDRGVITATVPLPAQETGHIILRTLPGAHFDTNLDWSFWTDIIGQSTGPLLRFGAEWIEPLQCVARGTEAVTDIGADNWLAHTPARVVYPYRAGLHAVFLHFGIDPKAYDGSQNGHTDGYVVRVVAEFADGTSRPVYLRQLDPFNNAADRGEQSARVVVPDLPFERLVITIEPGPYNDPAFDWTYLRSPHAIGVGPSIEIDETTSLTPTSSRTLDGEPVHADENRERWPSHAPARIVYERPAWLAAVDLGFGIEEGAYANPEPNRRTDGIEVVVSFERPDGTIQELFRRRLDPVRRAEDRGPQRARVALPAGEPGRLVFAFTAGPAGDSSFDWSYWTAFTGERVP